LITARAIFKLIEASGNKVLIDNLIKKIKQKKISNIYGQESILFNLPEFIALKEALEFDRRSEFGNSYVPYSSWEITNEALVRSLPQLDSRFRVTWVKDLHLIEIK
jgi:hypothetical protein